ncbi:glycerol-3-phosphate dehydrogenase [Anaerosporomusa subterranea]|uniref:Glycerol-3-phosphate dehydrogenase [NAD(P)+] n=1 Tax=Anaerosporomusa subterranea TaxID=1794912 RepID=A0A154BU60_ANASB|nr:NAD(P)H-dependent glycerol-3-phosphate dehydrogenase [Anaerosporomusa subterranea]KYZ77461.1 glycerol-3-phosphate dehydrogenase [Anaerosporomusa subterranea]
MKAVVIGAGSWGTALARMLAQKYPQDTVTLWARRPEAVESMTVNRQNDAYLPGVLLPESLAFTYDLAVTRDADVIVLAVPSHAVRQTAAALASYVSSDTIIVSATKGLEQGSLKRMSQVIGEELPSLASQIAILTGPNHAEEVSREHPSATVVAAPTKAVAEYVQDLFILPYFRVYTNPDVIGVELGGALKNIIALSAGIATGLGFGDNTKAALMTRGLAEITRLGVAMNANALTFAGLSGIGDLVVTCTSSHSRNHRAGVQIGQGKTASEVQAATSMVIESIRTTQAAYQLAQHHAVSMPITTAAYQVLYEAKHPKEAVLELMTRGRTHEVEELAFGQTAW